MPRAMFEVAELACFRCGNSLRIEALEWTCESEPVTSDKAEDLSKEFHRKYLGEVKERELERFRRIWEEIER